jgi:hypothetical protein
LKQIEIAFRYLEPMQAGNFFAVREPPPARSQNKISRREIAKDLGYSPEPIFACASDA